MDSLLEYLPLLAQGTLVTVKLTLYSACLALPLAFLFGTALLSRNLLFRWASRVYMAVFQGTSLVIQLFWVYYVFPMFGLTLDPFTVAVLVFGLNLGSYGADVVRGALQAVPSGQFDAATALSFSQWQRFRIVILPQALKLMILPFATLLIVLLKATSLASLVTIRELTFNGEFLRAATGNTALILFLVMLIYYTLSTAITFSAEWLNNTATRTSSTRNAGRPLNSAGQPGSAV